MTINDGAARAEARRLSTPRRIEVAHEAVADFQASAPVLTGAYRDGGGVVVSGDDVTMVNRDPEASYKEFGTSDTPVHGSFVNAARRHGRYTGWTPNMSRGVGNG